MSLLVFLQIALKGPPLGFFEKNFFFKCGIFTLKHSEKLYFSKCGNLKTFCELFWWNFEYISDQYRM